jgi:hypothetical protein
MQVKSFGCSFIFGSELSDEWCCPSGEMASHLRELGRNNIKFSKLTWPAHVAQYLGYEYQCYANPGSGNLQIMERVLGQVVTADPALIIIGWTWIDRFDYINPLATDPADNNFWNTITPTDQDNLSQTYFKQLQSEFKDKLSTLASIRLIIDVLKQKKLPFIMTYMDELMFDHTWHLTPAIIELQNYIKPYMTKFEDLTFLDWSTKHNYPVSNKWHPLEQAHVAASEYIIQALDKKSIGAHCRLF